MADEKKKIQCKITSVGERKEFGDKGFSKLVFQALANVRNTDGSPQTPVPVWSFEIFGKGEHPLDKVVGVGVVCEVEYTEKIRQSEGETFINRNVKQIYIDGKPQAETEQRKGGGGGWRSDDSPEKRASIEAQAAYHGLIELAKVKVILPEGELFVLAMDWAAGKLKASMRGTPATQPATKPAPAKTKEKPKPKDGPQGLGEEAIAKAKEMPAPEVKPEQKVDPTPGVVNPAPEPTPAPEAKPEPEEIDWGSDKLRETQQDKPGMVGRFNEVELAQTLKEVKWTISTLRSFIASQKWGVDTTGNLKDFIPRLSTEQQETLSNHLEQRKELM